MKKALALITLLIASSFYGEGALARKVKIINNTEDTIQVFFRGKGASSHHKEYIRPTSILTYDLAAVQLENKDVFYIIASSGQGGDPDWKLLGGVCSNLERDKKHTVLIEKSLQGLKTSCTVLTDE